MRLRIASISTKMAQLRFSNNYAQSRYRLLLILVYTTVVTLRQFVEDGGCKVVLSQESALNGILEMQSSKVGLYRSLI